MPENLQSAKAIAASLRGRQTADETNELIDIPERRRHPRRLCSWPAVLHVRPFARHATVQDISISGCRLNVSRFGLRLNAYVVVDIPSQGLKIDGMIVWQRGDEVGIRFDYGEDCVSVPV